MASQTARDLRSLVARRAGLNRRVALLSGDEPLVAALRANGCDVLVDPASTAELEAFRPQVVVGFDGLFHAPDTSGLQALVTAAPDAEFVLSFAVGASASGLLMALVGHPPPRTLAESEVALRLASAGLVVAERDAVVVPHAATGLAVETEAALRQLLEQVNPAAAIDRLLVVARRGPIASKADRQPGLLSVIVSAPARTEALDVTLRALTQQAHRPLEVVLATPLSPEPLDRVEQLLKGRAAIASVTRVSTGTADAWGRFNRGLEAATGQYVAFLEAGDLVEPGHFERLVGALQTRTEAWALGPCVVGGTPVELPPRFSLERWVSLGAVEACAFVLDRERVGPFPLTFAEGSPASQAVLLTRLAVLFPPLWLGPGPGVQRPVSLGRATAQELLELFRARPLRSLGALGQVLAPPEKPQLTALVEEALEAKSPQAAKALGLLKSAVTRVRDAAVDARRAAREELEKDRR
jgi:hypothetical protein